MFGLNYGYNYLQYISIAKYTITKVFPKGMYIDYKILKTSTRNGVRYVMLKLISNNRLDNRVVIVKYDGYNYEMSDY